MEIDEKESIKNDNHEENLSLKASNLRDLLSKLSTIFNSLKKE